MGAARRISAAWEAAKDLPEEFSLEYFQHLLVTANVRKSEEPIEQCIRLMADMRDTWEEAFRQAASTPGASAPQINQHGAALLNLQG